VTLTLAELDFLTTPAGAALLQRLAQTDLAEANTLALLSQLRRDYSPQQAGAALTQARLRHKAAAKFGADAALMLFTPEALEQASDPLARQYRAQALAGRQMVDACCGIGADSLAFAQAGADVTGLDSDPLRVALARHNAAALGLSARFEVADVRAGLPPAQAAFFDPARRDTHGRRLFDVERYQPPLSVIRGWQVAEIIVKLAPGVDVTQLEAYRGAVEFVSVAGDLKEALLWLGWDRPACRATLLRPDGDALHLDAGEPARAPLSPPRAWLVEPDPAVLRAGLVADLALRLGACQLDPTIAYLTMDAQPGSPWARAWRLLDWMPLNLKRLRAYLRAQDVGQVTVKKRGIGLTPEAVSAALRLKGTASRTLVLTRCAGQPVALVCQDYTPG
jgi:SAM-dependent methyltransferase